MMLGASLFVAGLLLLIPSNRIRTWILAALLAVRSQASDFGGGLTAYHGGSPLITMLTMLPVLLSYLSLLFWPSRLAAVYVPVMRTGLDGPVILALLVLGLVLLSLSFGYMLWPPGAGTPEIVPPAFIARVNERFDTDADIGAQDLLACCRAPGRRLHLGRLDAAADTVHARAVI